MAVACVLGTIVGAGSARAQGIDGSQRDKVASTALLITYGTTFAVQMYDAHTTLDALDAGARETNPLLARSIRNRFPYIDPLNHVQIELLRRHRAGDTAPEVVQGIHLSINGIAAGLRNSG